MLSSDGKPFCTLPDLPDARWFHTLDGHMLCGGYAEEAKSSCLFFDSGRWKKFYWRLKGKYYYHSSWRRPDGGVQLMKGDKPRTEIVTKNGREYGFETKYRNY